MTRPRNYETEAIVIKKVKLGEADRILTLYTPTLGKIQGVARGVRRPKSKLAGHLELLTYSQVSFARGRNLDVIIGSQTIESFLALKNDLTLTSSALYLAELVEQFTVEHVENQPLFTLFLETLHHLNQGGGRELALRHFEMHLLDLSGYRPELKECAVCREPLQPVANYFSPSSGGALCPACRLKQPFTYPLSLNALKVLRWLQASDLGAATRLKMDAALSRELEMLLRAYLKCLLERELKSAAWLDSLRETAKP
jgi:DNA repair protein RecO (recombination protein O)